MGRFTSWRIKIREPFGVLIGSISNIHARHPRFYNRTVLVENNDVDGAFTLLNKLNNSEGISNILKDTQRFIPPTQQRRLLSRRVIESIVSEEMDRKMRFLMRKNRKDPFPGQLTT